MNRPTFTKLYQGIAIGCTYIIVLLSSTGCQTKGHQPSDNYSEARQEAEANGVHLLASAREALGKQDFEASKSYIKELRTSYPMATTARKEALLLWDSIGWMEAEMKLHEVDGLLQLETLSTNKRDSLQSEFEDLFNRIKFYKRKLNHDKQELRDKVQNVNEKKGGDEE